MQGLMMQDENVAKIISKTKWQTRRLITPFVHGDRIQSYSLTLKDWTFVGGDNAPEERSARFTLGERFYIKQRTQAFTVHGKERTWYLHQAKSEAGRHIEWGKITQAMFMPYRLARVFCKITDIRAEQLGTISYKDSIAEGVESIMQFKELWESIAGPGSWEEKLWIWVYTFKCEGEKIQE